ncbi:MAG: ATP-dependent DNA helicase [Gammaproteobacteria bacterium]|nr:ATP-dependent DNA helicase [Gammaproteobacteria bacterium]
MPQQTSEFILESLCRQHNLEPRVPQIMMANEIDRMEDGTSLVIPADTGTGKSLAYSAAAISEVMHGGRVLISTSTKILQDQLSGDLPGWVPPEITVHDIRGKNNYRCPMLQKQAPTPVLQNETADTISEFSGSEHDWKKYLSVDSNDCLGAKCQMRHICPSVQAHRNMDQANIVLTNHSMLALELKTGFISKDMPFSLIIIDEAHDFESYVMKIMAVSITSGRLRFLHKRLKAVAREETLLPQYASEFDNLMVKILSKDEEIAIESPSMRYQYLSDLFVRINGHLASLQLDVDHSQYERASNLRRKLRGDLQTVINWQNTSGRNGIIIAKGGNKISLEVSPLSVANFLDKHLWSMEEARIVLTSATLPFDIHDKLGMKKTKEVWNLPTVFDYQKQGLLFVPNGGREELKYKYGTPNHGMLGRDQLTPRSQFLLNILQRVSGGSLVLFASNYDLNMAYKVLRQPLEAMGKTCHKQGQYTNPLLMEKFKSDVTSVLFATRSFEQGVDFPGPTLQCVVFDRVPNPPSQDLWIKALTDYHGGYVKAHKSGVYNRMRQAAGRAIRTTEDRALVVVLDHRFAKLTRHLQEFEVTHDVNRVVEWLGEIKGDVK